MTELTVSSSIIKRRGRSTGAPRCVRRKADSGWWFMPREVRFRSVSLSRNFKRKEFIQLQFSKLRVTPSTSEMGRRGGGGGGGVGFGRIPDRWLQYQPVGKHVEHTRFIPFKCPLDANFFNRNKELEDDDVFTVDLLLEMAKRVDKKIGLVIDLTNTQRYYYPAEFTSQGIEYQKLNCPGHEVDTREDIVQNFNKLVTSYLQRAPPDTLIGVHCTHGLNRTGYLIGRYMIDEAGWNAEEFINMFEHCRGHPIERQGYKDKLKWAQEQRDSKEAAAKAENELTQ